MNYTVTAHCEGSTEKLVWESLREQGRIISLVQEFSEPSIGSGCPQKQIII